MREPCTICDDERPPRPGPVVDQVIAANSNEYRAGKTGLLGFFVGQVMRQSVGNANPRS